MLGPMACLALGLTLVIAAILVLRFHPFLALLTSAWLVALASERIPMNEAATLVTAEFGAMMGKIGILLALAAMIGKCIMDSGAAERIVRAFARLFGPGREHHAMLSSSFALSVPVFFDTVFYLLAPLTRSMYARKKRDYVMIILAVAAGGTLAHSLVPPTPGPTLVAEQLGVSLVLTMGVGVLVTVVPLFAVGIGYIRWINNRMQLAPRSAMGIDQEEANRSAALPDSELPPLWFAMLPFAAPVLLLTAAALAESFWRGEAPAWIGILGDKNTAFFVGTALGAALLARQTGEAGAKLFERLEPAIRSGAVIAMITAAGGAFGRVLAASGIGEAIAAASAEWNAPLLVMAYLSAVLVRIAQGSATVAMITAAGVIAPAIQMVELPFHPVYFVAAIGFGATGYSWMNDSGFWLFSQLTGLTEWETLKTWTVLKSLLSVAGFLWVLLLAWLLPLV